MLPIWRIGTHRILNRCSRNLSTQATKPSPESQIEPPPQILPDEEPSAKFPDPPDPLSCCGSGCTNCVWIQYADDVSAYFDKPQPKDSKKKFNKYKAVKKEMEKHVEDENLRTYLLMEVKAKLGK